MYSMPQQAVTKGYWKIENLRAQPKASFNFEVKKFVGELIKDIKLLPL
jgi:hypothetical protein